MIESTESLSVGVVEVVSVIAFSTLFSLGGGNGQLAIIQDHWVAAGVLSPALFAWAYAIGNFVPGPKVSFVAGVGYFLAGFPGAFACLIGVAIPTAIGASLAAHWYERMRGYVEIFLPVSGFVIAGMMLTAGIGLAVHVEIARWEVLFVFAVAGLVWLRRWDPALVVGLAAVIGSLRGFVLDSWVLSIF
ncbi:chromate transporter [Litorivicinus sp.]|jgi:chromate transporter|nr:chromate transporter [Litorivicinus sp.]MDC1240584.1 chromate transporter [Litorivicinus sp.]